MAHGCSLPTVIHLKETLGIGQDRMKRQYLAFSLSAFHSMGKDPFSLVHSCMECRPSIHDVQQQYRYTHMAIWRRQASGPTFLLIVSSPAAKMSIKILPTHFDTPQQIFSELPTKTAKQFQRSGLFLAFFPRRSLPMCECSMNLAPDALQRPPSRKYASSYDV